MSELPLCGFAPESLIEVDGLLERADDAEKRHTQARMFSGSHTGRVVSFSKVRSIHVETNLVEIGHQALPWPIIVTEGTPVLIAKYRADKIQSRWTEAGLLQRGHDLLLPEGPRFRELITGGLDLTLAGDKQKQATDSFPYSWLLLEGLSSLVEVAPTVGDTCSLAGLESELVTNIRRGFFPLCLEGDQLYNPEITRIRRVIEDIGIPLSIIGCPFHSYRETLLDYCRLKESELVVDLTPDTFGFLGRENWEGKDSYRSDRPVEDRMRQAAFTLFRILLTMSAPGLVEKKSSVDYRLILRGRSAAMVSFPDNDRRLNALYRVYTSESPHCTKVRGKRYQLSPISSIKLRPYVGPIYQFDVKPSYPSLVTAGAAVGSTSWHDIKGAGAFATELCRNFMGRLNNPYTWRSESGQGQVHVT